MNKNLFQIRTDLAIESAEEFSEEERGLSGVSVQEREDENTHIRVTDVHIKNDRGARCLGSRWAVILRWRHRIWHRKMRIITEKLQRL